MPTYEYECSACGHTFEVFQSMSDAPLSSCPECGKAVRRLIFGGAGVIFKGSGFYVNDSRKGSSGGSKSASPGKPSDGTAKDGAAKDGVSSGPSSDGSGKEGASKEKPAPSKVQESA